MIERSKRVQKVDSELRQVLAEHLLHAVSEPLPCFASITDVVTSGDLRTAKVTFVWWARLPRQGQRKKYWSENDANFSVRWPQP